MIHSTHISYTQPSNNKPCCETLSKTMDGCWKYSGEAQLPKSDRNIVYFPAIYFGGNFFRFSMVWDFLTPLNTTASGGLPHSITTSRANSFESQYP